MSITLAIETSCDETAVAIVENGHKVLANIVSSQVDMHADFGGVVPEVASRLHLESIVPVVNEALAQSKVAPNDISLVAATKGPGLIGALLIGVSAAKAIALAWGVPYVGVNHVEGHLFAVLLENPAIKPPFIVLLVAGGHTQIVLVEALGDYKILGATIDDAAGEAFDKVARYLGLGYPGGPILDKLSQQGDPATVRFPRGLSDGSFNFSFSGLKTAVVNYVKNNPDVNNADIAASFQDAVVDVLVAKTIRAAKVSGVSTVCLGGGVSANSQLRSEIVSKCEQNGLTSHVPSLEYCTDNAAMIAAVAAWQYPKKGSDSLSSGANPSLSLSSKTL